MSYRIPRIVYPSALGTVTLDFTYPDTKKPMADPLEALRHDSMTSSGLRQTMVERVDIIKNFELENIPWADLPALSDFMHYAVQGGSFQFFPDATQTAYQTWELSDDKWDPRYSSRGLSRCSLKMRLVPGGDSSL